MTHFRKTVAVLFILVISVNLFAQDDILDEQQEKSFQPKFTLGSGIYTLTGDIQNKDAGFLKGKSGFNAGMKFDLVNNFDLSFLILKIPFSANDGNESFYSDLDGFGLSLGYTVDELFNNSKIIPTLSLGIQRLGVSTTFIEEKQERSSAITIPLAFGVRMGLTERLQFDILLNFGLGMSDIDMSQVNEGNADGYKSLNFAVHYDLFTRTKNSDQYDDSYYADVDFTKLEAEDQDRDMVRDMDDYCPNTPIGVKVDENGCPLDDDKDGIPNYLDQQKDTPEGSIVDEDGVKLTADQYKSMYSDLEVASRKYANFYNEVEIKRENYRTIDEYLIAKANAFNKAFNESLNDELEVPSLVYKVKIAEFKDGVPADITNKLLSLDDLESFIMDDDVVVYTVGNYFDIQDAMSRRDGSALESKGFDDNYIVVYNNGDISNYIEAVPEPTIDENEIVNAPVQSIDTLSAKDDLVKEMNEPIDETTYRIQIGAFDRVLSNEVFVGVKNVNFFTGRDGLVRYVTGSFIEYRDALDYQAQMKARGFEDAFIVTYKNGKRISLNVAIRDKDIVLEREGRGKNKETEVILDLKFIVQIMVAGSSVSAEDLKKISTLGSVDKQARGSYMFEYYAGTYSDLASANIQLEKAKKAGFPDAFVFATYNGKRITLEQAENILK